MARFDVHLNPVHPVQGTETVMVTQLLAAVPVSILAVKAANLDGQRDQTVNAVDLILPRVLL
jgi:hypothetical protein